jgi:hypothetical protein
VQYTYEDLLIRQDLIPGKSDFLEEEAAAFKELFDSPDLKQNPVKLSEDKFDSKQTSHKDETLFNSVYDNK